MERIGLSHFASKCTTKIYDYEEGFLRLKSKLGLERVSQGKSGCEVEYRKDNQTYISFDYILGRKTLVIMINKKANIDQGEVFQALKPLKAIADSMELETQGSNITYIFRGV